MKDRKAIFLAKLRAIADEVESWPEDDGAFFNEHAGTSIMLVRTERTEDECIDTSATAVGHISCAKIGVRDLAAFFGPQDGEAKAGAIDLPRFKS